MAASVTKYAGREMNLSSRAVWPPMASPTANDRNHTPSIWLLKARGASSTVTDRPTGLRDSSPNTWMRYTRNSHQTETLPNSARRATSAITTKLTPITNSPKANFWAAPTRLPSLTHRTAKTGTKIMMSRGLNDCVVAAVMRWPKISRSVFDAANSFSTVGARS